MGKIRIKTLGTPEEQAQKEKAKVRREEKKKRLTRIPGLKGGERIPDMSVPSDGTATFDVAPPPEEEKVPALGGKKAAPRPAKKRSKNYLAAKKLIDSSSLYPLEKAIELVKKTSLSRFDGSVEIHINTTEKGIQGRVSLPHGTGQQIKVAIANDKLVEEIEKGKTDFDILVASPAMMSKLAKVAKILGPRGLMPNPKNGTITNDPEGFTLSVAKGQIQFKTETEAPIIHLVLGKVSFPPKHLEENFKAAVSAIGPQKIKNITIKSTMSPGIKVQF